MKLHDAVESSGSSPGKGRSAGCGILTVFEGGLAPFK